MKLRNNQQPRMFDFMSSASSGVSGFAPNVECFSCAWLVLRMVLNVFGKSDARKLARSSHLFN